MLRLPDPTAIERVLWEITYLRWRSVLDLSQGVEGHFQLQASGIYSFNDYNLLDFQAMGCAGFITITIYLHYSTLLYPSVQAVAPPPPPFLFMSRAEEPAHCPWQACVTTACWDWETVFTCLYPNTVQTRLSRDQRPTKPVSRLGTGRGVGGSLSAIEILNTVEKHEWTIKKKPKIKFVCSSLNLK